MKNRDYARKEVKDFVIRMNHAMNIGDIEPLEKFFVTLSKRLRGNRIIVDIINNEFNQILPPAPLIAAAKSGNSDLFELLLKYDNARNDEIINVVIENENGCTPLYYAVAENNKTIIDAILNKIAKENHAQNINKPSNPPNRYERNPTPFMKAARMGNDYIFEHLYKNGGDIALKDRHDNTILHYAALSNNPFIFSKCKKFFDEREEKIPMEAKNLRGETPLYLAVKKGNKEFAIALISHGADVNVTDKEGKSVLYSAVVIGDIGLVRSLLSPELRPNARETINAATTKGITALYEAIAKENLEMVNLLCQAGADLGANNIRSLARQKGNSNAFGIALQNLISQFDERIAVGKLASVDKVDLPPDAAPPSYESEHAHNFSHAAPLPYDEPPPPYSSSPPDEKKVSIHFPGSGQDFFSEQQRRKSVSVEAPVQPENNPHAITPKKNDGGS